MPTKRHHYLPLFLLARFLPPGETTFIVHDKKDGSARRQAPVNTGVEGHLYTVLDPRGEQDDVIETDILGPLDGAVAPLLAAWDAGRIPGLGDLPTLATFLAASHVRTPRQVAATQEIVAAATIKFQKDQARDPAAFRLMVERFNADRPNQRIDDIESFRQTCLELEEHVTVSVDSTFAMVQSLSVMEDIADQLLQMEWQVVYAEEGDHFVLGDATPSVLAPYKDGRVTFGAGFGRPDVEVAFPVDPRTCLLLRRHASRAVPTTEELNRRMIYQAERFIVSSVPSGRVAAMVKEFADTFGKRKIDLKAAIAGSGEAVANTDPE